MHQAGLGESGPEDHAVVEVLRDILLLLAAIGASLSAILVLSLALPGQPPASRIEPGAPAQQAVPLKPEQPAERRGPAWRVAAQE